MPLGHTYRESKCGRVEETMRQREAKRETHAQREERERDRETDPEIERSGRKETYRARDMYTHRGEEKLPHRGRQQETPKERTVEKEQETDRWPDRLEEMERHRRGCKVCDGKALWDSEGEKACGHQESRALVIGSLVQRPWLVPMVGLPWEDENPGLAWGRRREVAGQAEKQVEEMRIFPG